MGNIYNSYFFKDFYKENGGGNYLDEKIWRPFFAKLAEKIIEIWDPHTVLDAGCANGYLLEELRNRGVQAYGIDISEFAINSVKENLKIYVNVQSVTEELPKSFPSKFDLITCIEVLEHVYSEEASEAIENLCKYSDTIIFSSTPDDITDQTHVNVQLPEYWARLYAENSFFKNVFQDMRWLSPWATLYEKREDIHNVINEYERKLRIFAVQKEKQYTEALDNEKKSKDRVEELKKKIVLLMEELEEYKQKNQEYFQEFNNQSNNYTKIEEQLKTIANEKKTIKTKIDKIITELQTQYEEKATTWQLNEKTLRAELEYYKEVASFERHQKQRANEAYNLISNATLWKITRPIRKANDFIKNGFKASPEFKFEVENYNVDKDVFLQTKRLQTPNVREHLWPECDWNGIGSEILQQQQKELSRKEMEMQIVEFRLKPMISVIVPLYNPPMEWLPRVIETLQAQVYPYWELCVVDDGSPKPEGREYMNAVSKIEKRIKFAQLERNGGISAASNAALAIAEGEFVALVDQDDEITPDAFFWMIKRINERPDTDFLYSDECKIDTQSKVKYFDFYFKPDWSPRLLMNHMYTGHLSMYRTQIVKDIGGFRSQYDFSQDYDLALRVSDITENIEHVERVLYFWRAISTSAATGAKDFARVGNMHALKDWYNRHNLNVVMQMMPRGNYGRLIIPSWPMVSVIIPTDSEENLNKSIHGLMEKTSYSNIEIIPVTNSKLASIIEKDFAYLEEQLRICSYDKTYNFSDKCNEGAKIARGEILLFYNDDVVPEQNDWLERLVELLVLPKVGSVSPMLMKPDKMIQYAGMIAGTPGLVGTAFNGYPADDYIYGVYNHMLLRDVTVLSGACFVIKKSLFTQINGFDAINTPNGHSDVDLSFKIIENGFYNVYTPYARLIHIGNHSWHAKGTKDKADIYCLKRWGKFLSRDNLFTESQKRMFYVDFQYNFKIYSPETIINADGKDILFVTHELSRTGAPIALKDAVRCSIKRGDFPVVLSYQDGELRQEFLELGVTVIVDESAKEKHWMFERFARNFDTVFINSIAAYHAIELLKDSLPKVYWWLHDGWYALYYCKDKLPKELGKNEAVLYVSKYVEDVMEKNGYKYNGQLLRLGVDIQGIPKRNYSNDKLRFLFIGSFEERKGPDILMSAISKLPKDILVRCEFLMIGTPMDSGIYKEMLEFAKKYTNITVSTNKPREYILELYRTSFAVIIPSRDEPLSLVGIESMASTCPVICSNHCGIADFIKNQQNGLVFESESITELTEAIIFAVKNKDRMEEMGKQGRTIYETYFTLKAFEENFANIVK